MSSFFCLMMIFSLFLLLFVLFCLVLISCNKSYKPTQFYHYLYLNTQYFIGCLYCLRFCLGWFLFIDWLNTYFGTHQQQQQMFIVYWKQHFIFRFDWICVYMEMSPCMIGQPTNIININNMCAHNKNRYTYMTPYNKYRIRKWKFWRISRRIRRKNSIEGMGTISRRTWCKRYDRYCSSVFWPFFCTFYFFFFFFFASFRKRKLVLMRFMIFFLS